MESRINWQVFDENTSSMESLIDFIDGDSLAKALEGMWDPAAKRELKRVARKGINAGRLRARRWLKKEGHM